MDELKVSRFGCTNYYSVIFSGRNIVRFAGDVRDGFPTFDTNLLHPRTLYIHILLASPRKCSMAAGHGSCRSSHEYSETNS